MKTMKKYLLIFVLLLGAVCSYAQGTPDQAAVLQLSINISQATAHLKMDMAGTPVTLWLVQGAAIVPVSPGVNVNGKQLAETTLPQIVATDASSYYSFGQFEVGASTANVLMDFYYDCDTSKKVLHCTIALQKSGSNWTIVTLNVQGGSI